MHHCAAYAQSANLLTTPGPCTHCHSDKPRLNNPFCHTCFCLQANHAVPSDAWEYHMRKSLNDAAYRSLDYVPYCSTMPVQPGAPTAKFMWVSASPPSPEEGRYKVLLPIVVCCYACRRRRASKAAHHGSCTEGVDPGTRFCFPHVRRCNGRVAIG